MKTRQFKDPVYFGDLINAVRVFNEKEVDELVFLDIEATVSGRRPNLHALRDIASECFMLLCYGGGVCSLQQMDQILKTGVEKVALNSTLVQAPGIVRDAARAHGSSTIVASIDYKRGLFRLVETYTHDGRRRTGLTPIELCSNA